MGEDFIVREVNSQELELYDQKNKDGFQNLSFKSLLK